MTALRIRPATQADAGAVPRSFLHARLVYVDAHAMFQYLSDPAAWPLPELA